MFYLNLKISWCHNTGRTIEADKATVHLSGPIYQNAEEVTLLDGQGIAVHCDHTDDQEVETLFDRIRSEWN